MSKYWRKYKQISVPVSGLPETLTLWRRLCETSRYLSTLARGRDGKESILFSLRSSCKRLNRLSGLELWKSSTLFLLRLSIFKLYRLKSVMHVTEFLDRSSSVRLYKESKAPSSISRMMLLWRLIFLREGVPPNAFCAILVMLLLFRERFVSTGESARKKSDIPVYSPLLDKSRDSTAVRDPMLILERAKTLR